MRNAATPRLAGFDGLRAVAALAIFVYHFRIYVVVFPSSREMFDIWMQLRVGVWIFFVLSGFLLYRPYAAARRDGRPGPPLRDYLRNRVLRVYPAYAVALVLLTYVFHKTECQAFGSFLVQLGLLQIYDRSELLKGIPVTWSLAVEVSFYALLPLYAGLVARASRRLAVVRAEALGLVALVATGVAWQIAARGHLLQSVWLPSFLPTFAVGIGLAVLLEHRPVAALRRARAVARHGLWCWVAAAVLLAVKGLTEPTIGFDAGFAVVPQAIYATVAALVVAPCALASSGAATARVLEWRPLRAVGVASFALFLWHVPIIRSAQFEWIPLEDPVPGRNALVFVTALSVTLAVGFLSWYGVERPMLRMGHRPRSGQLEHFR